MKRFLVVLSGVAGFAFASFADIAAYQNTISNPTGGTAGPTYWWKFDNDLSQSGSGSGGVLTESNGLGGNLGGFTNDFFGNANLARFMGSASNSLNTGTDVISGGDSSVNGNASASATGSLVVVFQTPGVTLTGQRFVFAQGSSTTSASNALAFFLGNAGTFNGADLRVGNTTMNLSGSNALALSTWYYLGITWKENRNTGEVLWSFGQVGGILSNGTMNINDLAVVGNNGTFTIGNASPSANSAFREGSSLGNIDELATYDYELSSAAINSQFGALVVPEPSTLVLCGSALVGLCMTVRRRSVKK